MTPTDAMIEAALDGWNAGRKSRNGYASGMDYDDMSAALTAALAVSGYGEVVEALRKLADHVAMEAMDRLETKGTKIIGWSKSPQFSALIEAARAALASVTPEGLS